MVYFEQHSLYTVTYLQGICTIFVCSQATGHRQITPHDAYECKTEYERIVLEFCLFLTHRQRKNKIHYKK